MRHRSPPVERYDWRILRAAAERGERATRDANLKQVMPKSNDATSVPTLADMGLTRDESSRYQQLAAMGAYRPRRCEISASLRICIAETC